MVKFPKFSIVTPSFNQYQFLEATIQSVLSQNHPNLEYIIIDGGSTDGSLEIIRKYEDHLHFWCSEPDQGQYDAINKGFAHSTGEIMAWLNSDDMYYPWAFNTVVSIMAELPKVEWLTTLNRGALDWHGFPIKFYPIAGYSREAFLDGYYLPVGSKTGIAAIQQESTFWRRSLWQKIGSCIRTEFRLAGDFDLWTRFYQYADLYGTHSPLAGFRYQANQKSRQLDKYIIEAEKSLAQMRDSSHWSLNLMRNMVRQLNVHRIPKLRKWIEPMYTYTSQKIIRSNPESPTSFWMIEESTFF